MIIKISKVKTYNWRISKKIKASIISGAYWIMENEIYYSTDECGENDIAHGAIVLDFVREKYTPKEFWNEYDCVFYSDWINYCNYLIKNSNYKDLEAKNIYRNVELQKYIYEELQKTGMKKEEIDIAFGRSDDEKKYAMKEYGWIRVRENCIQLWSLDSSSFYKIKNGISKILDIEGINDSERYKEKFYIDTFTSGDFADVPYSIIEDNDLSKIYICKYR